MNVLEMKEFLRDQPDDREIYIANPNNGLPWEITSTELDDIYGDDGVGAIGIILNTE